MTVDAKFIRIIFFYVFQRRGVKAAIKGNRMFRRPKCKDLYKTIFGQI